MSLSQRLPYEWLLGWRYTRAGRATRRNGFISFISAASMLGIALGVAALIIVLSVMNGFQKDVAGRMLSVISHVEVFSPDGAALPDPQRTLNEVRANPEVIGAAPFIGAQGLLARGETMQGAIVRGIDPAMEPNVTDVAAELKDTLLPKLVPGEFGILLGADLARKLGVVAGDQVTLIAPSGQVTPAGVVPRLKQMTVVGTFSSGHYEYDSALAMLNIEDAARIFRLERPTGIRLKLRDLHHARQVADQLAGSLSGQRPHRHGRAQQRPTDVGAVRWPSGCNGVGVPRETTPKHLINNPARPLFTLMFMSCFCYAHHSADPASARDLRELPRERGAGASMLTMPLRDASRAPVTPPRAGDRAGVRREPRAGDAAARR